MRADTVKKLLRLSLLGKEGFTLVELIMGLSMSAIVMAGIYVIVSGAYTYILKGTDRTNLQRDFSLVEQVLAKQIRKGKKGSHKIYASYADYTGSGSPQSSGKVLKLYFPAGDSALLYRDGNNFKIQDASLAITTLVPSVVDSLWFTDDTTAIISKLTLLNDGKTITGDLVHAFRNASAVSSAGPDTLRPTGVGTWSNNSPSGASYEYQCVDEVTPDGSTTYVYPSYEEDWRTDTYATEDGSGTGTVDSVVIYIRARGYDSDNQTRTVVLLSGTRYYGSIVDLGSVSSFTNFSTNHTTNPATSSAWTWSEVNAMEIGVRLYRDEDESNPRCTQVWALVYYTE